MAKRPTRRRSWRDILVISTVVALLVGIAAVVIYVLYLDRTVQRQFADWRWALPARVYAQPLELYPGRSLTAQQLADTLQLLHYEPVKGKAQGSGSYARLADTFEIMPRRFAFSDGRSTAEALRVAIADSQIVELHNARSGAPLKRTWLEPLLIGSIYPARNEDRILIRVDEMPPTMLQLLYAVEDRKFARHHGIDWRGILRAMWANLRAGQVVQGGSTLTQQLVKNLFLSNERTLRRKLDEAVMALLMEQHYSKDQILEAYFNEIYLGQDGERSIHGFALASEFYFQRPLRELTLHQQALLIGLVRGPSHYDPRRHPQRALERRNLVLDMAVEEGAIKAAQAEAAKGMPLGVSAETSGGLTPYPAFMDVVRSQLRRDLREDDLTSQGLQIFTTLDPLAQQAAEAAVQQQLPALERRHGLRRGTLQAAAVVSDTRNAEVLAIVGGRDVRYAGFNRAADATRPIGSLVKPAVYLAALTQPQGFTLTTLLNDQSVELPGAKKTIWRPANYDRIEHGQVPLYLALAQSYNLATVDLGLRVGLNAVIKTLQGLGVEQSLSPYPSMLLGAVSLSPLEVLQMYQTIADGGQYTRLRVIRAVVTHDGQLLQRYASRAERRFDAVPTYLLTSALREVVRSGTAGGLSQYLPASTIVAGKTGTTDDLRDSWFTGFGADRVGVVWVGRDDNEPARLSGATGALPVWGEMMRRMGVLSLPETIPEGVELVTIDPVSGLRGNEQCEGAVALPFAHGTGPEDYADCAGVGVGQAVRGIADWFRGLWQ